MAVETDNIYPEHIYDPMRIEIAKDYMKRECRKYWPSLRGKEIWTTLDQDIDNWFKEEGGLFSARDFWNGFHGIAMGFKLKVGFIQVITAENITWHLIEELPLDNNLASGGGYTYISDKLPPKRPRATDLRVFFEEAENRDLAKKWRIELESYGTASEPRDHFPIVAMEEVDEGKEILSVHDGNRRMALAILQGKQTINAYVGRYTSEEKTPKNFWLPTSFLMEVLKEGKLAEDYDTTLHFLQSIIHLSDSGLYELKNRAIIGNSELAKKLKRDMGFEE